MGMTTLKYDRQKRSLIGNLTCIMCGYQWILKWPFKKAQWKARWEECPNCGSTQELINPMKV